MPRHLVGDSALNAILSNIQQVRIALGSGALASLPSAFAVSKSIVALGKNAMAATTQSHFSTAIGPGAMENSIINRDDIAIGELALRNIQATTPDYSQASLDGTRMIGVGGNAGLFAASNYNEVLIGRNASQCKTSGYGLVAVGSNALAGHAQYGWATPSDPGGEVVNNQPWGASAFCRTVAVGANALNKGMSLASIAVGGDSLLNAKASDDNVAIGALALSQLDVLTGYKGGTYTTKGSAVTYSQSGTTVTVTLTSHGLAVGTWVYLQLTSGAAATYGSDQILTQIVSVATNTFNLTSTVSRTTSGNGTLVGVETTAAAATNDNNTAVGRSAGGSLRVGTDNTLLGRFAASLMQFGGWNVIIGSGAAGSVVGVVGTEVTNNTLIGYNAYASATGGSANTAIGANALRYQLDGSTVQTTALNSATGVGRNAVVTGNNGTAIGNTAKAGASGTAVGNGASNSTWANATAIGNGATNTADNQVQLGNSAATAGVRAFGIYTNASDIRDKANIRQIDLGLDFINDLLPVNYQLQPRETGIVDDRYHHGFLAQDLMRLGVFGGIDDSDPEHLAVSYSELIAPLVKAVQELTARVQELEGTK